MSSSNSPCAACKLLRRKCTLECVFAPYFPPEQPQKFANVHKVFGASNVTKILNELSADVREDAVNSLAYEAEARLRDPVYGCVGFIAMLQQRLKQVRGSLASAKKELATYMGPQALLPMAQQPQGFIPPHYMGNPPAQTVVPAQPLMYPMAQMASGAGPSHGGNLVIREPASTADHLPLHQIFDAEQLAAVAAREEQEMMRTMEQQQLMQQQQELFLLNHSGGYEGWVAPNRFNRGDFEGPGMAKALYGFNSHGTVPTGYHGSMEVDDIGTSRDGAVTPTGFIRGDIDGPAMMKTLPGFNSHGTVYHGSSSTSMEYDEMGSNRDGAVTPTEFNRGAFDGATSSGFNQMGENPLSPTLALGTFDNPVFQSDPQAHPVQAQLLFPSQQSQPPPPPPPPKFPQHLHQQHDPKQPLPPKFPQHMQQQQRRQHPPPPKFPHHPPPPKFSETPHQHQHSQQKMKQTLQQLRPGQSQLGRSRNDEGRSGEGVTFNPLSPALALGIFDNHPFQVQQQDPHQHSLEAQLLFPSQQSEPSTSQFSQHLQHHQHLQQEQAPSQSQLAQSGNDEGGGGEGVPPTGFNQMGGNPLSPTLALGTFDNHPFQIQQPDPHQHSLEAQLLFPSQQPSPQFSQHPEQQLHPQHSQHHQATESQLAEEGGGGEGANLAGFNQIGGNPLSPTLALGTFDNHPFSIQQPDPHQHSIQVQDFFPSQPPPTPQAPPFPDHLQQLHQQQEQEQHPQQPPPQSRNDEGRSGGGGGGPFCRSFAALYV